MSDPVRERLDSLRARLILSSAVVSFHYHQEETVGDIGYFRVRCTLIDGSELQLIERFRDVANALTVEKYEGETGVAQAHAPIDAFAVLSEIEKRLSVDR